LSNYQELIKKTTLNDDRFVVFTAENRAVVRDLPPIIHDRFIDVGITEQNMIGMAAGMALRGRIPICHALTNFLLFRAYEFIRNDVGIPHLPIKLSGWIPGFLSDGNGPTHQSLEDVGIMRLIPGMQVFCPSDNEDMCLMLEKIWNSPHPSYVRVNPRPAKIEHKTPFEIGKAETLFEGKDVTILVYGFLLEEVLIAREILEKEGLSVGIVNMRSLEPIDSDLILSLQSKTNKLVTVEDHFGVGGLFSIVCEIFTKHQVMMPVQQISMGNRWFKPGLLSEVLDYEGFTGAKLANRITKEL
jgi:transketolase